jgi:hypothetical protein
MASLEKPDKSQDYGYFTFGVLMLLIGTRFFVGEPAMSQGRLFTGLCFVFGVVILATAPKYMWRFSSLCMSIIVFGALSVLYGMLLLATGETGGPASQHTSHTNGVYPFIAGVILVMFGFVLKRIHSLPKP